MMIDITGLDPAEVLLALFRGTTARGLGALQEKPGGLQLGDARTILEAHQAHHGGRFDYLMGRPLKIDLPAGATGIDVALYDRDATVPAAQSIAELRERLHDVDVDGDVDDDDDDLVECTFCGGDGVTVCDDPIQCLDPACTGTSCTCRACDGRGYDQRSW
jgi:hypothetical protein